MPDCFLAAKLCPPKNLRGGILELGHGNDVVSVHSLDYYNTANSFCKGAFCLFLYNERSNIKSRESRNGFPALFFYSERRKEA